MLKRIQANYSVADTQTSNEIGFMPTVDEMQNPDKSWEEIVKLKEFETSFKGKH